MSAAQNVTGSTLLKDLLLLNLVCWVLFFLADAAWWVSCTECGDTQWGYVPDMCPWCILPQWSCCLSLDLATTFLWSSWCRHYRGQGWACGDIQISSVCPTPSIGSPVPWWVVSHGFPRADSTYSRPMPTVALWYSLSYLPAYQPWLICIWEDCFLLARWFRTSLWMFNGLKQFYMLWQRI